MSSSSKPDVESFATSSSSTQPLILLKSASPSLPPSIASGAKKNCSQENHCLELLQQVLYFDTDSVIYSRKPGQPNIPLGGHLGDMTNELKDGDHIIKFRSAGPKNYGYKTAGGEVCCNVRGFSLNVRGSRQLNYEVMKQNLLDKIGNPRDELRKEITELGINADRAVTFLSKTISASEECENALEAVEDMLNIRMARKRELIDERINRIDAKVARLEELLPDLRKKNVVVEKEMLMELAEHIQKLQILDDKYSVKCFNQAGNYYFVCESQSEKERFSYSCNLPFEQER